MKVSNETKVGALTVIAVTMLVLGYNFLKGKSILKKTNRIYAVFNNVGTIERSNVVKINGFQVGTVSGITNLDKRISKILLTIDLTEEVEIPKNSVAVVQSSLTTSSYISIIPGESKEILQYGDTLTSRDSPDIIAKVMDNVEPALADVKQAVDSLKLLLGAMNRVFDEQNRENLKAIIGNLRKTTEHINQQLAPQGDLAKSLNHLESITENLERSNEDITHIIENLKKVSTQLSNAEIEKLSKDIAQTNLELQQILKKINSKEGNLGLLVNDTKLYESIQNTTRSLNILLDDLKTHPKRYINISVFGKKDNTKPLMAPLADSAIRQQ